MSEYIPQPGDMAVVKDDQPNGLKKGDVVSVSLVRGDDKHLDVVLPNTPYSQPLLILARDLSPIDLDDIVHDLCSNMASNINNEGAEGQMKFLEWQLGTQESMREFFLQYLTLVQIPTRSVR